MIQFVKGIFFDQSNRISKMLEDLSSPEIHPEMDKVFLEKTIEMLQDLNSEIQQLINSGDLDIEVLTSNNIIKYNTCHERLLTVELFRYLVIINYGNPEIYFKKKIARIYNETNCLQKQPIITTISNSENYYWALPSYDIIAVPVGEERNLLNLPDLYHEMGHLIYNQYDKYLIGDIRLAITKFYEAQIQRVVDEQRDPRLISIFRNKAIRWSNGWVMEFTCDLIATYLVGPAYAWTNIKLTTLSSGKDWIYKDSASHPSDEARMRGVFFMLQLMGYDDDLKNIDAEWKEFLSATKNPIPANYLDVFPQELIEKLAKSVFEGCKMIDLRSYHEQIKEFGNPISKILNDAWKELFSNPDNYHVWEKNQINEIGRLI